MSSLSATWMGFAVLCGMAAVVARGQESVRVVDRVAADGRTPLYPSNREPLVASPLVKLPIGSIVPGGWLRHMLELEAQGMTGRLAEISPWLKFETSAWADKQGKGQNGWEELPYWLKGFGDLGYILQDKELMRQSRRWIEAVLASQDESGWFGPRDRQRALRGHPDLWPNMIMLNALQSYYEQSGDRRVLTLMTRYFQWQNARPISDFAVGYWPMLRMGDNLESVYWLYNRTGDAWLLDLAKKIHAYMADWTTDVCNWHNVNIAQGFREPAVYSQQASDPRFWNATERNYQKVMDMYGQFPGGGFAGDENCRPGFVDPRQGFETCGIVEFMHSFEMLTRIGGSPIWADRCEELAFNTLPAAMTPDLKGLHYLTCANQVQLDKNNKSPGVENVGTMFAYSPREGYRCCQHNVSHGWPYYAEELWLATADRGLCASLYAACEVTARVGDGATVKIVETTDYPFSDTIQFKLSTTKPARFPLYLRVPRWSGAPELTVNGRATPVEAKPPCYVVVERSWADGDVVSLRLPMRLGVRVWKKNKDSLSVDYGPLTFSLKIGEEWRRCGGTDAWPEWEVFPTTPWNYGLAIDPKSPAGALEVVRREGPLARQPFTPDAAPFFLRAKVRRVPSWKQDELGLVGLLPASPVRSDSPLETVTLIPMGAARLRVTAFPTTPCDEKM